MNISHLGWQWLRHITQIGDKHSNASLNALSSQIHQWNIARISTNHLQGLAQSLSIEHVHALREIIHASMCKTAIQRPEIIADQLLFLAIGAIQIESQNGSSEAWQLVNRAIQKIATPKKDQAALRLSLISMLFALSTYIAINPHINPHDIAPSTPLAMVIGDAPDPVTISMLEPVSYTHLLVSDAIFAAFTSLAACNVRLINNKPASNAITPSLEIGLIIVFIPML